MTHQCIQFRAEGPPPRVQAMRHNGGMPGVPASRIRTLNPCPSRADGRFVLYWMTAFRRTSSNFALERALEHARHLGKPLVILEALRVDYPWASDRLHRFVIDGMAANATALSGRPVTYYPYLEPSPRAARGLIEALAADSCVIVTDDYPAFFLPRMQAAAAGRVAVCLEAVDSNGLIPMRAEPVTFKSAYSFRAYVQRTLRGHLGDWPSAMTWEGLAPPIEMPPAIAARWPATPLADLQHPGAMLARLPIDHSVVPTSRKGGTPAAYATLRRFVDERLSRYVDQRNHPDLAGTSELSPYLHFGHISPQEVFSAVMSAERWTTRSIGRAVGGKREGWWGASANAEAFLDQLVTWRELGFNMCATRPDDYAEYASLPPWARATLAEHAEDPRERLYTLAEFETASTHDVVWNAAQRQLTRDGWMHNYLRMLWGKKILEWTPAPAVALQTMIALMDRHALDGRDPNSYAGYGWTLGRYDRAWGPERAVFGTVRYMSSDNTVRKLKIKQFLRHYAM